VARSRSRREATLGELVARQRWWLIGAGAVIIAAVLLVVLWPSPTTRTLPPTRARQYLAFDACLLTGAQGLADPDVGPVWAGMQDASLATRAKVSYLAVAGPQTLGNAEPYANTLLQRQCSLVIGVGQSQVDAVEAVAKTHPNALFAVLSATTTVNNVTAVAPGTPSAVRESTAAMVKGLVH
jgi:hypothetical protein